ncbi:MAG: anti-sigma factor [Actinomycetota bacterium]|nr:anti-sigma factor [Actinomycetota bacterium]
MQRHSDLQELLGAYAVDALDKDEEVLVESHVRRCRSCREEVESLREVLGHLTGDHPPAPREIWDRIASSLGEKAAATTPPITVRRQPRRQSVSLRVASALAAAAILVIGFMSFRLVQQERRITALETTTREDGLLKAAALAAADPRADRIRLTSPDESLTGEVVVLPDGEGYLVSNNLPDPGPESSYQLWALVNETRISLGLLENESRVTAFHAPPQATGLAVTEEPAGGVPTSERTPLVVGFKRA